MTNPLLKLIARRPRNLVSSLLLTVAVIFLMSMATGKAQTLASGMVNYATEVSPLASHLLHRVSFTDTNAAPAVDLIVTATTVPTGVTIHRAVAPIITSQPDSTTVTAGDVASFTVVAGGSPEPSAQWQFSDDDGDTFNDLQGETNLTLSFMATGSQSGYQYRVVLTNLESTVTSDPATLTVDKQDSSLTLTSSQNPSGFGQSVLFTATVMSDPQEGIMPTGTVQFLDGDTAIAGCEAVSVDEGQAICQSSALTVGSHTITASYSGDDNSNTSTSALPNNPQVVNENPAPTLGNYANSSIVEGCTLVLTPDLAPSDDGVVVSVTGTAAEDFIGSISVDAATGVVIITGSSPVGTYTITLTATDDFAATAQREFTLQVVAPPTSPTKYDFDGDKKADLAFYRPADNENKSSQWHILRSSDNVAQSLEFGSAGDVLVPGDYNGDGMTDVAVYQPSTNIWFTSKDPSTNYDAVQWGSDGDIPAPGFYDADQKTDIAVFRPSDGNWYIAKSTGGSEIRHWGESGDKPVLGDYDGDGLTDVAVWRQSVSTWFIQQSTGGTATVGWGISTDIPVPADYDGDSKTDVAVWRPSTGFWYIQQSSNGMMRSEEWGQMGDIPVSGDYDHDGKADIAVYRPTTGVWYIFSSCQCMPVANSFGSAKDIPVPSAFNLSVEP